VGGSDAGEAGVEVEDKPDMRVPLDRGREGERGETVRERLDGPCRWAGLGYSGPKPFLFFFSSFFYSFLFLFFYYNFCLNSPNKVKPRSIFF
jgi:hypothetical protein